MNGLDVQAFLVDHVFYLSMLLQMFSLHLLTLNDGFRCHHYDFLAVAVKHLRALLVEAPLVLFVILEAGHELMEVGALSELCFL